MRVVVWFLILLVLAYSAISGCWNGWVDLQESKTFWDKVVSGLNLGYGIAGAISLLVLRLKKEFAFWPVLLWATLTFACATSAVILYTPEENLWSALAPAVIGLLAVFVPILIFVRKNLSKPIVRKT